MNSIPSNAAYNFTEEHKRSTPENILVPKPPASMVFRVVRWFKAEGKFEAVKLWSRVAAAP
jgi:hypothetical protein